MGIDVRRTASGNIFGKVAPAIVGMELGFSNERKRLKFLKDTCTD
jgi:hypothetical protein